MKKLHLAFGITALAVLVIGLLHGAVAWIVAEATWEPLATSFPTWGAFVLPLLFYSLGVFAILTVWLITWLIVRSVRKRRLQKGNQSDIISL